MRVMTHFGLWMVGLAEPLTQTTERERQCLARYAAGRRKLVEIGVWHGVTTCYLRRSMEKNGELLCVDPYRRGRLGFSAQKRIAHRTVSKIRNGRVRWMRTTGDAAGRGYNFADEGPVDFIFIDGDHSYDGLQRDWEAWNQHVGRSGIVALHDSRSSAEQDLESWGSAIYTREVIAKSAQFRIVDGVDTLTVLERVA
jgi:predicted O-methyltransferase YrrM